MKKPRLNDIDFKSMVEKENQSENHIVVEKELRQPHSLVRETRKLLLGMKTPDQYSRFSTSSRHPCLDIQVDKGNIDRALRIMDALIKGLEARGYSIKGGSDKQFHTVVSLFGEEVGMHLLEKVDRKENPDSSSVFGHRYLFIPTGRLEVEIDHYGNGDCRKKWTDSTQAQLENQINDIIIGIITSAKLKHINQEKFNEEQRIRNEERKRQQDVVKQKQDGSERCQVLEKQAEQWNKAQNLRAFIEACRNAFIKKSGSIKTDSPEAQWLEWATGHADELDPLKSDHFDKSVEQMRLRRGE